MTRRRTHLSEAVPLNNPHNPLDASAQARDFEKPKSSMQTALPTNPRSMTGLRPNLSDAIPHNVAVSIWGTKKADAESGISEADAKCKV